jgi:proteic killer suppression protein
MRSAISQAWQRSARTRRGSDGRWNVHRADTQRPPTGRLERRSKPWSASQRRHGRSRRPTIRPTIGRSATLTSRLIQRPLRATYRLVIKTFADKRTVAVFEGGRPKSFPTDIVISARRRLTALDAADSLADLRNPPPNRLQALKGDRAGQHSIRVNSQWRVCFRWKDGDAYDVEVTDYH